MPRHRELERNDLRCVKMYQFTKIYDHKIKNSYGRKFSKTEKAKFYISKKPREYSKLRIFNGFYGMAVNLTYFMDFYK
jgi:hypothetical protein